jgi:hypothetical protein
VKRQPSLGDLPVIPVHDLDPMVDLDPLEPPHEWRHRPPEFVTCSRQVSTAERLERIRMTEQLDSVALDDAKLAPGAANDVELEAGWQVKEARMRIAMGSRHGRPPVRGASMLSRRGGLRRGQGDSPTDARNAGRFQVIAAVALSLILASSTLANADVPVFTEGPPGPPSITVMGAVPARSSSVEIRFTLPAESLVRSIIIVDVAGRRSDMARIDRKIGAGTHGVPVSLPRGIASGVYFVGLITGDGMVASTRWVLVR